MFDIIVVGGGTAGMSLAIHAADLGGRVLVIEKSGQVGGTMFMSGGHVAAAGTRLQKRLGIEDTPELHYEDIQRLSHGLCDPEIARLYVNEAPAAMDWLEDIGLVAKPGDPVTGQDHSDFSARRYYQGAEFGVSIQRVMQPRFDAAVASEAVRLELWTSAIDLLCGEDGAVTGVVTQDMDGVRKDWFGRATVLTTGGYCASAPRFTDLAGAPNHARRFYPYCTGDGLDLATGAGGVVSGAELQKWTALVLEDRNYPSPIWGGLLLDPRRRMPWEIQVNRLGQRFMREDNCDIDARERSFSDQPEVKSWLLFDQEILDRAPDLVGNRPRADFLRAFDINPLFAKADTLEELAWRMRLPGDALKATVVDYNRGVETGEDRFGRQHLPLPIVSPPYYMIEMAGGTVVSAAGVKIDSQLRVVRDDGSAIPNLYAAGEIIGARPIMGDVLVSGGMITPALTFGRYLARMLTPMASA